ncbi:MAG: hypothetical protein HYR85_09705 [Planctomycetes bacterium]|nr:hypothetical protein [Planctomycetota bacterium]MBI3847964.1 hypothetical protein [Planctomycetota bacterium]
MTRARGSESGFFLVAAVALFVLGGILIAAIAELAAGEADSSALRVESANALAAAQSGLEMAFLAHTPLPTTSFGGGTFTVTQSGRRFTSTGAWGRAVRVVAADAAFPYVDRSRQPASSNVIFRLVNLTSGAITLNAVTSTWITPTAYYEEVRALIVGGTDYGKVWDYTLAANTRKATGETATFNVGPGVVVPEGAIVELTLFNFKNVKIGSGSTVSMDNTSLGVIVRSSIEAFALTTVRTP